VVKRKRSKTQALHRRVDARPSPRMTTCRLGVRCGLAAIRPRALAGAHLRLHRLLHVGGRHVVHVGGNRPAMAERILDLAVAIT
jgi:hypothetical protein